MSYSVAANMTQVMTEQILKDLTCDEPTGGEYAVDWSKVQTALDAAQGMLDGRLSRRVAVPVAAPTAELIYDEQRIGRLYLFRRRGRETDAMLTEEKRLIEKYDAIADGRAELVGVTDAVVVPVAGAGTAAGLTGFWRDPRPPRRT